MKRNYDYSKPVLTDQSDKKLSDINNIMKQYAKTGLLPMQKQKVAQYIDNTLAMPLEQAHALIRDAKEMFLELPAEVRKKMNNDPTQLVDYLKDKDNHDFLVKHGVLNKKQYKEGDVVPAKEVQAKAEGATT